jgi:Ni/Co efflux regulator RcnB
MRSKAILSTIALASLIGAAAPAFAQGRDWDRDHRPGPDARAYEHRDRDWREAQRGHGPVYSYGARGPEWRRGGHVPREYLNRVYVVENWRAHRLPPPHRGYHWIQVGGDFVLVTNGNGVIAQIVLG